MQVLISRYVCIVSLVFLFFHVGPVFGDGSTTTATFLNVLRSSNSHSVTKVPSDTGSLADEVSDEKTPLSNNTVFS